MAFVNRPGIADADYKVTTHEIVEAIRKAYPGHPRMAAIQRIANNIGVESRRFTRPLEEVTRTESFGPRNARAYADVCRLAEAAARRALTAAGLTPADISTIITFHATGLAIPGLDVHLVNALEMPQTVRRVPMTQLACAGGAQALGLAAQLARPGQPVLVAGAEALSTVYQHSDAELADMIYKLLFGDGGAAAVVSAEPLKEPGLYIEDTWTYLHRDQAGGSTHYYKLRADCTGYHFDSTPAAVNAVAQVAPEIPWIHHEDWAPEHALIHPGSSKILDLVVQADVCSEKAIRHSRTVLEVDGNTGGPTVLRILERVHDDPPSAGSLGILFGVGPGFCASASLTRWTPSPSGGQRPRREA
ncbi:PhlD [Streptomyces sp. bgisy154]|uniref:PhlD n=1 Tax=Streptomyces sp. bgisy154 TaxID=3413794 RepID=UPI003D732109